MIVIDATNAILGRLASFAAKQALLGNEIAIVNAEKAIIVGNEKNIVGNYMERRQRGGSSQKGPNFPTLPEMIMKRTIRGMINYKSGRGQVAFKRIKCFRGMPDEFKDSNKIVSKKKKLKKFTRLENLSMHLRGKAQ
ncbi:50S ribosomal protein L13 [Candidatus Pacearchaeota archaeon]|nr:50S ribosomal protein L13 [Candidatus Pacearchaeota archaeon]